MGLRKLNSGFVLVMVLAVLAIAGTILAAAARRCAESVLEAGAAQRELQVKWGALSCRAVYLPGAERILQAEQASRNVAVVSAGRRVMLGTICFNLIVSDEQAKGNVNLLARRRGNRNLAAAINALQSGLRVALPVELRPARPLSSLGRRSPAIYTSFGHVFAFEHPSELVEPASPGTSAVDRITCWGNGMVNFKRAELPVMREILAGVLDESELHRLVSLREEAPDCTLGEALKQLELSEEQLSRVQRVLTDRSRCHSLWIIAETQTRNWYRFHVDRPGDTRGFSQSGTLAW